MKPINQADFNILVRALDAINESVTIDGIKASSDEDLPTIFTNEFNRVMVLADLQLLYIKMFFHDFKKNFDQNSKIDTSWAMYNRNRNHIMFNDLFIKVVSGQGEDPYHSTFTDKDQRELVIALLVCSEKFAKLYSEILAWNSCNQTMIIEFKKLLNTLAVTQFGKFIETYKKPTVLSSSSSASTNTESNVNNQSATAAHTTSFNANNSNDSSIIQCFANLFQGVEQQQSIAPTNVKVVRSPDKIAF